LRQAGTTDEIKAIEMNLAKMGGVIVHDGTAPDEESTSIIFKQEIEPEAHSITYEIQADGREFYARFWYDYRKGEASVKLSCQWMRADGEEGETKQEAKARIMALTEDLLLKVVKYEGHAIKA